ncbi:MAG: tRNA pseudouridine(38-40) synthase TruA [Planctomycetota bacterium]
MFEAKPPNGKSCRIFALTLAYDGTHYHGWQIQNGQDTIQARLEAAIGSLVRVEGDSTVHRTLASGRTDAGVHAQGQVVRVHMPTWSGDAAALARALNTKLPDDIAVIAACTVNESFHPIADAIEKTYRYRIQMGGPRDVFGHRYVYRVKVPLDLDALQGAAKLFLGTHDFASMEAKGAPRHNTVRTLTRSAWTVEPSREPAACQHLQYTVTGNGFLYNMVRNLVGTMLEVGRGKQRLDWVASVLASKDRSTAGPTAPASGLCLMNVRYPPEFQIKAT